MKETKAEIQAIIEHLNTLFTNINFVKNGRNGFIYLDVYRNDSFVKSGIVCEKSEKVFLTSLQTFKSGVNFTFDNK